MFRSCLGVSSCVLFELHIVVAGDASDILCAQDNSRHRHQTWTVFPFGGYCSHLSPDVECLGCRPSWPHNDAEDFVGCLLLLLWSHSYCATAGDRLQALVKEACELLSRVDALSVCGKVTTYLHFRMTCTTYLTASTGGLFMLVQNQLPHYLHHISDLFQLHVSFVSLINL